MIYCFGKIPPSHESIFTQGFNCFVYCCRHFPHVFPINIAMTGHFVFVCYLFIWTSCKHFWNFTVKETSRSLWNGRGLMWPWVRLPQCYNRWPCCSSTGAIKVDAGQQGAPAEAEQARQHSISGPGDTDVIWDTRDVFACGEGPVAVSFCHAGAVMGWNSRPAATTRYLMRCPTKKSVTWTWLAATPGFSLPSSVTLGPGQPSVWTHDN